MKKLTLGIVLTLFVCSIVMARPASVNRIRGTETVVEQADTVPFVGVSPDGSGLILPVGTTGDALLRVAELRNRGIMDWMAKSAAAPMMSNRTIAVRNGRVAMARPIGLVNAEMRGRVDTLVGQYLRTIQPLVPSWIVQDILAHPNSVQALTGAVDSLNLPAFTAAGFQGGVTSAVISANKKTGCGGCGTGDTPGSHYCGTGQCVTGCPNSGSDCAVIPAGGLSTMQADVMP